MFGLCLSYAAPAAGILFQLDADTFRTVVAPSKRGGKALVKTLRSIELLQSLTVHQLEQLAQIMRPVSSLACWNAWATGPALHVCFTAD